MKYDQLALCAYCKEAITRTATSNASWKSRESNIWRETLCDGRDNPSSYHYPEES